MKLKFIAAAALLAATGANAAITNTGTGNSDLYASFYSVSQNATFTVDLGISLTQFTGIGASTLGVNLVWDLDGSTFADVGSTNTGITAQAINYGNVFTTFNTPAVAGASDLMFTVNAGDGTVSTPFNTPNGQRVLLSTSSAAMVSATNSQLTNSTGANGLSAFINPANLDTTNSTHGTAAAGANMYDAGDSTAVFFPNGQSDNIKASVPFNTTGSVNSPLSFFSLSNVGASALAQTSVVKYAGTWNFDAAQNQLSYVSAPVPEPESYAMLLAGLGLMGAIARRRKQK